MNRKQKHQRGQSLLEVIFALAIGIIIATAFVSLGAVSVRNSRVATDQVTATKFAQEGMEAVITIRDQNSQWAILNNGANNQWSKLQSFLACAQPDNPAINCDGDFLLQETTCTPESVGTPTPQRCITKSSGPWTLASPNQQYSRKIRISDSGTTNVKNVTVFVWWTDSNGLHKSTLSRSFYKEKLQ